jgi:predicted RNase H-like HicB family nuclease
LLTQLARDAVANAVVSTARAGIPLTGYVDGRVQTIRASDPRIAKFLQEQSAGLGVPSIQIERDPDTGLLVGNMPGVPGAHTQGETVEELCAHLTEVLKMLQEHAAVALKRPLPEHALDSGALGVVVHVHGQGAADEVEFLTQDGHTDCVETLQPEDLAPAQVQTFPPAAPGRHQRFA